MVSSSKALLLALSVFIPKCRSGDVSFLTDKKTSCTGAGPSDTCTMTCDDTKSNGKDFDCLNAGTCIVHCTIDTCLDKATIDASNSNTLYIYSSSSQCYRDVTVTAPNYGSAYFLPDPAAATVDEKLFKRIDIVAGTNTELIHIECARGSTGSEDCRQVDIDARTAYRLEITGSGIWSGDAGNVVQCPENSIYEPQPTCFIDVDTVVSGTFKTVNGIPNDVIITSNSMSSVTITCDSGSATASGTMDDFLGSACWDTLDPTNDPTQATLSPTKQPSDDPTEGPTFGPSTDPSAAPSKSPIQTPTASPSDNPSKNPSKSPTGNPSKNPSESPTGNPVEMPTMSPLFDWQTANPSNAPTNFPINSGQVEVVMDTTIVTEDGYDNDTKDTKKGSFISNWTNSGSWIYIVGVVGLICCCFGLIAVGRYMMKKRKRIASMYEDEEDGFRKKTNNEMDFWTNPVHKQVMSMSGTEGDMITNILKVEMTDMNVVKTSGDSGEDMYDDDGDDDTVDEIDNMMTAVDGDEEVYDNDDDDDIVDDIDGTITGGGEDEEDGYDVYTDDEDED